MALVSVMEYSRHLRSIEEEGEGERKKWREREKERAGEHRGHKDKRHPQEMVLKRVLAVNQQNSPNYSPWCVLTPAFNFVVRISNLEME